MNHGYDNSTSLALIQYLILGHPASGKTNREKKQGFLAGLADLK